MYKSRYNKLLILFIANVCIVIYLNYIWFDNITFLLIGLIIFIIFSLLYGLIIIVYLFTNR